MAAYFLPSYFQKRLLRYALSRLDFIDSDELDLDNLGLTWGQRTVIELKNVAIKVQRLRDLLQLPPSIVLNHASIKVLRLTLPADLHVSGIQVQINGVEVIVGIRPEDTSDFRSSRDGSAPSKTDRANLPRIPSPASPKSSANRSRFRHDRPLDASVVLPTSEDLAASFLDSEPPGEKDELQAVIESQSQYIQDSFTSAGDEVGLGMPGGLSLPSFVANFFKGIADRLSLQIRDINIVLESESPATAPTAEVAKFMLTISTISVEATVSTESPDPSIPSTRSIKIEEVQAFVLSDAESFSESSGLSSPKLARSRLRLSHPTSRSRATGPGRSYSDASQGSETSKASSRSTSSSGLGLGLQRDLLSDSTIFSQERQRPYHYPAEESPSHSPIVDNQAHAEQILGASKSQSLHHQDPSEEGSATGDLAESRVFTHDEAESMYLSAVSGPDMPGGWNWSGRDSEHERPVQSSPTPEPLPDSPGRLHSPVPDASPDLGNSSPVPAAPLDDGQATASGESILDISLASFSRSRILHVDHVALRLPQTISQSHSVSTPDAGAAASLLSQSRHRQQDRPSRSLAGNTSTLFDSQFGETNSSQPSHNVPSNAGMSIKTGHITIDLDVRVCKMIIKSTQSLLEALPPPQNTTDVPSNAASASLPAVIIEQVDLNFCECVPRRSPSKLPFSPLDPSLPQEQAMLRLTLFAIAFSPSSTTDHSARLTISKIEMKHGSRVVLSFVDSVNVRDSIATSSMLRPHDVVVHAKQNRYEVQVKPAHVILDLLVIDEVLSRSGGLDSLLDLGNSIMSTNTIKGPVVAAAANPDLPKQRTVRFNDSHTRQRANSDNTTAQPKVDIRISGAILDLIGSESSLQIRSSAIKTASRDKNIKLRIDGAAVEGPIMVGSKSRGDAWIKIRDIELYYSDVPTDNDLDRLLSLITPSSDRYDQDDDIIVDNLIKQRRKGGVLRLFVKELKAGAAGFHWIPQMTKVADEIAKLSSVTKLLPEDERPGVLIFGLVDSLDVRFDVDDIFGPLKLKAELLEGANVAMPSLAAAQIASITLSRSDEDVLIGEVTSQSNIPMAPPMFMCRFIADEMEPTVRMKLSNTCFEYKVPTVMALTSLLERLKDPKSSAHQQLSPPLSPASSHSTDMAALARKIKFSLNFRDCAIALNPDGSTAKGLFVLTDAVIRHELQKHGSVENLEIKKASLLIINDSDTVGQDTGNVDHKLYFEENDQVQQLTRAGFVPVGSISSASAIINVREDKINHETQLDIEFRNNLLFLETCADSTQTLFVILGGLAPPAPPSKIAKYRTEIVPIHDMLASFTGAAFVSEAGPELGLHASHGYIQRLRMDDHDPDQQYEFEGDSDDGMLHANYHDHDDADDEMTASYVESTLGRSTLSDSIHIGPVEPMAASTTDLSQSVMMHSMLDFRSDHFVPQSSVGGTAHRWNSTQNTYGLASDSIFDRSPVKVRVRDVHVIWNLFDGYDWQSTRDVISQAVQDIESKAMARRPRSGSRTSPGLEDDEESVIGDFLFNSIYIGIPANKDPRELANAINHDIDDMVSETGSYATNTTVTAATARRQPTAGTRPKKLRLNRSKHHKMAFELAGVSADFVAFPPASGEVESSVDIRVKKLEVFDHIPTSTWKKFATYMQDAGEREVDTNMVHIEVLNVKPVPDLAASEIVLKVSVLPLRLHVDQDALDFLTRFFEFKDENARTSGSVSNPPFIQRVEINPIQLRLDFKPKRVDYGGLRSGRTTEFMNFFVLDRSDMVLRRVILYGVSGFDRMGIMLNNIWSPDVKRNQLPGVLAGLAPIRPLVDVTSGVRDLVTVPIREYRKDGRLVRSIQKGAIAFAKTTAAELVNLGAKLAIGTQTVLQNTEELLVTRERRQDGDEGEEGKKQISLYADQPLGIVQGLRGAYASLERDLLLARDAIVAVPGEVMASGSATGAARAVLKQSPTIILRPAIGASKAVGQTLLGAGNTLDKKNLRRMDEVSHIETKRRLAKMRLTCGTEIQEALMLQHRAWETTSEDIWRRLFHFLAGN